MRAIVVACLMLGAGLGLAGRAFADGDPASDVLAGQTLYLPQDADIPSPQVSQLTAITTQAQRGGLNLRVALIATRSDLGSVTALWRQPRDYARFLALELPQVFHGTLLVAMPDGYGIAQVGSRTSTRLESALFGLPAPGTGASLAMGALTALQRVAAVDGHRLTITAASHLPAQRSSRSASAFGLAAWLTLGTGTALIAAAWVASLRAQPLRRRDGVASSHGS